MTAVKPAARDELRILVQYRTRHGKAYELVRGQDVIALHISPPGSPTNENSWHVTASLGAGSSPSLADGWGSTAAEALQQVAVAWTARVPSLAAFNWDAIAQQLHVVRAV